MVNAEPVGCEYSLAAAAAGMQLCQARTVWQACCCSHGLELHPFHKTCMRMLCSHTIAQIRVHNWTPSLWHFSIDSKSIKAASCKPIGCLLG